MEFLIFFLFASITSNVCVVGEDLAVLVTASETEQYKNVCHGSCQCVNRSFRLVVDCSHGQLQAIPTDLPENTTELQFSYNKLSALKRAMFYKLTKLEILNLSFNEINDIEPDTFSDLGKSLTSLYLTCNRVPYKERFKRALTPMLRLQSLYIQQCLEDIKDGETFPAHELKQMPHLTNLSVDLINKEGIRYGIKPEFLSTTFFVQDMWQNRLTMANNTDLLCPNCNTNTSHVVVPLPQQIEVFDISQLDMDIEVFNLCMCEPNSHKEFYMRQNKFRKIDGPLMGMKHVQLLDLSDNFCVNLSSGVFHFLPYLRRLLLSGNLLSYSLERDKPGLTFQSLSLLNELDLSFNRLRYLPSDIFKGLTGLEILKLNNNKLKTFAVNMQMTTRLNILLLNHNNLRYIPQLQMKQIDKIMHHKSQRINLANNNFQCNCTDIEFVRWIQQKTVNLVDDETYRCTYIDETTKNLTGYSLVHDLEKECASYTLLIVVASILMSAFLSILTGGIIYRYRWDLRYLYYSTKFRMKGYIPVDVDEDRFRYDVFVSYSDQERHFVVVDLLHELEESRSLKLCIHERDFFVGGMVTENIVYAINNSRKTLLLLSRGFIESHWCRYELNMARMEAIKTGRDVLCTVKMEEIMHDYLPLEVIDAIRSHTYIQHPGEREHMDMFWDRLYAAISG
ncbi:toll-like receptor 4 [Mya arenaria]|uniref:toll-like receptor 4 n=1 Tax=Mya arenaria TaxID=6604 RepID=UPI0022E472BA|nr:toll-like receptor 4 [Mya arenaria]